MKSIVAIAVFLLSSSQIMAQGEVVKQKSLFFEMGGSGGFGSFNFEKSFYQKEKNTLKWRVGLSILPIDKNNGVNIISPIMVHYLYGQSAHKLELGLGQGITVTTKGSFYFLTTAALGYRYQKTSKRLFYRATYTPLISYLLDFQVQQWAGLSIGYQLKHKAQ